MKVEQQIFTNGTWERLSGADLSSTAQLVIVLGSRDLLKDPSITSGIRSKYPGAQCVFGSTAGDIAGTHVYENSVLSNALSFEKTGIKAVATPITDNSESEKAGNTLGHSLPHDNLKHVLVFSDGLKVNGSALAQGLMDSLPRDISVTGGLTGDNGEFKETVVGLNGIPGTGNIVAVGFYGNDIEIGYGSFGGWDTFGLDRIITKSSNNILYELDGKPALSLYKEYLGEKARELPGSGLLFPLSMKVTRPDGVEEEIVRTLLSVNDADQSMTFAGDLPEGKIVHLMKANFDRLIDGAGSAAKLCTTSNPQFALLISCVGRKLVLKERVEEELEAVRTVLGGNTALSGFYSYGEICPSQKSDRICKLHNQTMTITTFSE